MTPDSLEAALRAVPRLPSVLGQQVEPDYPALAAAVRGWIGAHMPPHVTGLDDTRTIATRMYNAALTDVARRLGL